MKTAEEARRELFEAYVKIANADDYAQDGERLFEWNGATYVWSWVNWDWLLWNAALDAVVIELPEKYGACVDSIESATDCAIDECRAAIESTNLGIKVK